MIEIIDNNDNMVLFMSDEAHFHLNGYVNKQNCRYWSPVNPQQLHEEPLHTPKVTVWCAIGATQIIGPYFFEDNRQTTTENSERYIEMLTQFFFPELQRRLVSIRKVWFQQDGATSHTARASMEVLRQKFPGRLISRFGDVPWPPRSPDLSLCDFFLWGHLKSKVYQYKPQTLDELKDEITRVVGEVPGQMLTDAMDSFRERLHSCIAAQGRHMTDIIFKT